MIDADTAEKWGTTPGFARAIRRWTWFRGEFPPLMTKIAQGGCQEASVSVDLRALARAFWRWVAVLDANRHYEPLDAVDFAHFSSGVLLAFLLQERPLRLGEASNRSHEVRALTEAVLTLLASWRAAQGAGELHVDAVDERSSRWTSYVENVAEDPNVAVAFLDLFTNGVPVWRFPMNLTERPPFQRALAERRDGARESR